MSKEIQTKSLHWDVAAALAVVAAAMLFLPFLRNVLVWPALLLVVAFAVLGSIAALRHKTEAEDDDFMPPIPEIKVPKVPSMSTISMAPKASTGGTDIARKSLADKINSLDWLPFEQLVTALYTTLGYTVKRAGDPDSDGGVDLILTKDKAKTFVQCRHCRPMDVEEKELKLFLEALVRQHIETGIFVTARPITGGARVFAAANDVLLVGTKDLVRMMDEAVWEKNPEMSKPLEQSRKFCPRCQQAMEMRYSDNTANPGTPTWCCSNFPRCNYTTNG
jgi:HJR/Mrr/RecB family endonuclease